MFSPPPGPRFVDTVEAARILGLSPRTLEKQRCQGRGPAYHKLSNRVLYAIDELEAQPSRGARSTTVYANASVSCHHTLAAMSQRAENRAVRR
jgi:hypothetical protein